MSMNEMMGDISYTNMREMLKDCLHEIHANAEKICSSGILSGFNHLDALMDGFEKGKVYVVGSRPCIGKEEFMLSMIRNITWKEKTPVLLFSTNHQKSDYVKRLLSIHCGIPSFDLHKGRLDKHELERLDKGVDLLADVPLFTHDSLHLPLDELTETAKSCVREKGIRIIFIDCLQMIDFANEGENASDRIARIMMSLKQLARSFDVPIVVGSMLNRGIENRNGPVGKLPQLADLASSCYIEELADIVMIVQRMEYYQIYLDDCGRDLSGIMEIHVRKNGLKPSGVIYLSYDSETGIVSTLEDKSAFASKLNKLRFLDTDIEALNSLITTFDLEEVNP